MRTILISAILFSLGGCQTAALRTSVQGDALARLETALPGEYDNHEQSSARTPSAVAAPHLRETWKALGDGVWLWHIQTLDTSNGADATWVYRLSAADGRVKLIPYRPLGEPIAKAAATAEGRFKFDAAQWAELAPCAQTGEWKNTQFSATADAAACSALLPGLGEAAALLPLRFALDGDMLTSVTFADQARGAQASITARRLRWLSGWAAINGGGPKAQSDNQDWHTQNDLRLSSEGGRVPLRWRDGTPSGWSLELARTSYPERKLNVLQLNVVDDASGRVLDYVWVNPEANAIGFNLGWLQVGLTQAAPAAK